MSIDLVRAHANVLFLINDQNRLVQVNESDPEHAAPLVFLALGHNSKLCLFREDVGEDFIAAFEQAVSKLPNWLGGRSDPLQFDSLRELISQYAKGSTESHGPAFCFPAGFSASPGNHAVMVDDSNSNLLEANFTYTKAVLGERAPVFVVVSESSAVSACFSARKSLEAAEAGVHTLESFRGQGLALETVSAWASAVAKQRMLPLYSTTWDNLASLGIAKRLGLTQYADTLSFLGPE